MISNSMTYVLKSTQPCNFSFDKPGDMQPGGRPLLPLYTPLYKQHNDFFKILIWSAGISIVLSQFRKKKFKQKTKDASWACKGLRERYIDFESLGNNFSVWLRVQNMITVSEGYVPSVKADLLKFCVRQQQGFTDLIENKITSLASDETQFGLIVKFSITRKQWNLIHGTSFQTEGACHSWHKQWSNKRRL